MLRSAVEATLGLTTKSDGIQMVKCWKNGEVEKVIDYCLVDTRAIKALHEHGREHGHVFYAPDEGGEQRRLEVNWTRPSTAKDWNFLRSRCLTGDGDPASFVLNALD